MILLHEIARVWDHCFWMFLHAVGADNGSGPEYGFWSGFGSDLSEIVLIGGAIHLTHQHNCHAKGCWRLGLHHYDMDGRLVKLCKKHHPNIGTVTADQVAEHARSAA